MDASSSDSILLLHAVWAEMTFLERWSQSVVGRVTKRSDSGRNDGSVRWSPDYFGTYD